VLASRNICTDKIVQTLLYMLQVNHHNVSVCHATIICTFVYQAFALPTLSYLELGTIIYWCVVCVVLTRLATECYTWTVPSIIIYVIALVIFPILEVIIYGSDASLNTLWGTTVLFGGIANYVWAVVCFVVISAVLFDVSLSYGRRAFFPNLIDIVIETDRGFSPDDKFMKEATDALTSLSRPQELPRDAVSAAVGTASDIPLAPRFRSAYAQDVPEGQNVAQGMKAQSRFVRFSFRGKRSFTFGSHRKSDTERKSITRGENSLSEPETNESRKSQLGNQIKDKESE